jgi:hypothetical protein
MVDLLALVEGLPDEALGALLLAWNRRYGEPVQVLGESFALRLPLKVDMVRHPASDILQMDERLPVIGNVAQGDWMEQWLGCASAAEAEALADRLRKALGAASGVVVRTAEPRPQDADCWEVLRFAGGLESPVAA